MTSLIILKWGTLFTLLYLYARFMSHTDTNYELIFALTPHSIGRKSDESLIRTPTESYSDYFDKIVLSEEEEARVITEYSRIEKEINVKTDCAIGVGYTTCMDINFRAVDMFQALESEF